MKILIISDTHRDLSTYFEVIDREAPVDAVIHCGDICGDDLVLENTAGAPVYIVAGNCDYDMSLSKEITPVLGDVKFFVTHGHHFGVNAGTNLLKSFAIDAGAKVVCYGHTHIPEVKKEDGILIINPGSLSKPRQSNRLPSYAILTIDENGKIDAGIKYC